MMIERYRENHDLFRLYGDSILNPITDFGMCFETTHHPKWGSMTLSQEALVGVQTGSMRSLFSSARKRG